jgi:trans-2,3-dihydro-3-hydroxyanthranilate isomerase
LVVVSNCDGVETMPLAFELLDVFAEEKYAGNQLAVVANASILDDVEMQRIANEMHFSETSFIMSDEESNEGYDVRIFTPTAELPFAGHPTLGTAYVIRNRLVGRSIRQIVLNLKVGKIPVTFEKDAHDQEIPWMKQVPPVFGRRFQARKISRTLGLDIEDIDGRFPIQEVSTGIPFVIVPLKTLAAVKRARVDRIAQSEKEASSDFLVFCPETYEKNNDLNVRVFVDLLGIPEDPATGSANGCLAGYLSMYKYFGNEDVKVRVEQGYEINRRSILQLKARRKNGDIEVKVGGKVVSVATGHFV